VKDAIMLEAAGRKFCTHKALAELPPATGNENLAEASQDGHTWGAGRDGCGESRHGRILMQVRQELNVERGR
jgi:predicted NAD-dependent protein-ADP-ribosyltransferase YbiA (DUF1768 family)